MSIFKYLDTYLSIKKWKKNPALLLYFCFKEPSSFLNLGEMCVWLCWRRKG